MAASIVLIAKNQLRVAHVSRCVPYSPRVTVRDSQDLYTTICNTSRPDSHRDKLVKKVLLPIDFLL